MLDPSEFTSLLKHHGLSSVVGVPDSTLADWIAYARTDPDLRHVGAVNECEAVAVAMGQYLATGRPSIVYMQNDGLGKTVNPHTSLLCGDVYAIPMLLLVGWRGEPGRSDAAQHRMMGRILAPLLGLLDIPHAVLTGEAARDAELVAEAVSYMEQQSLPYALIVRRGLFSAYPSPEPVGGESELMTREDVIRMTLDAFGLDTVFVATTGKASRELFELRHTRGECVSGDLYTVGGMGCAAAIGLGVAQSRGDRQVCVIDGDGAALMQLGTLATIGREAPPNLKHIVIDNHSHDSTGGQPTAASTTDITRVAEACGYRSSRSAVSEDDIRDGLATLAACGGPALLRVRVRRGARPDLGRPIAPLPEVRDGFMAKLRGH